MNDYCTHTYVFFMCALGRARIFAKDKIHVLHTHFLGLIFISLKTLYQVFFFNLSVRHFEIAERNCRNITNIERINAADVALFESEVSISLAKVSILFFFFFFFKSLSSSSLFYVSLSCSFCALSVLSPSLPPFFLRLPTRHMYPTCYHDC